MPKKYDVAKKQEWFKLYEEGKTEKWIARRYNCDLRTVRKAISDIRLKHDTAIARIELVKEALRKHQESLLEELDQIMSSVVVPEQDFAPLSWYHGKDSVLSEPDDQISVRNGVESVMRRLLKEHLKNDKLWRSMAQWEKANTNSIVARAGLQRKTAALIKERTGYKLVDSNDDSPPFICAYTAGPLFYSTAIKVASNTSEDSILEETISRLQGEISINTDNGDIKFRNNLVLAVAFGSEQSTKKNLLSVLIELVKSPEIKYVLDTNQVLEQITAKTRHVVENIRLLGLVPGQCEICRRLGA